MKENVEVVRERERERELQFRGRSSSKKRCHSNSSHKETNCWTVWRESYILEKE